MKSSIQTTPGLKPSQAALALAVLFATHAAQAQNFWTGTANSTFSTSTNWSPSLANSNVSGLTFRFNGNDTTTSGAGELVVSTANGGGSGGSGSLIDVTALQTNALTINGSAGASFRLGNSSISIASGAGAVTFAGVGGFTIGGVAVASTHTITNNSSNLLDLGNWTVGPGGGGNRTVSVSGSGNVTSNGVWSGASGTLALNKSGAGTLTLGGNNTFTGATALSAGNLVLTNGLALQNSALTISGTGNLSFSGFTSATIGGLTSNVNLSAMSGSGSLTALTFNPSSGTSTYSGNIGVAAGLTITKSGAGTQVLTGNNSYSGGTTVSGGTLSIGATSTLGININTNNVAVGAGASLTLAAATNAGTNQTITLTSNASGLSVLGLGFNGLPNASIAQTDTNGGVIAINGVTGYNTSLATLMTGKNLFVGGIGTSTFTGAAGTIPAVSGFYKVGGGGGAISFNTTNLFTGANALVVGSNATNGGGIVILGASQNYTGSTTINGGTLRLGHAGALGDGITNTSTISVNNSAIFDLGGFNPTANATLTLNSNASGFDVGSFTNSVTSNVTFAGNIDLQAATVRAGANSNGMTLTGTITGNGKNFIKDGSNRMTLANSGNVSLGNLQIFRGVLQVNSGTDLIPAGSFILGGGGGVSSSLVMNGGSLTVLSNQTATFGGGAGTGSSLTLTSGTLTVPKLTMSTTVFSVNFNGGTLKANADSTTFLTGAANGAKVQAGGAFIDDGGFAITIGQALIHDTALDTPSVTLDGGLTKSGVGTLTLSGNNTYTGATNINAGTLVLGNATGTLADSGAVNVSGGTLDIGTNSDTVGTITLTSGSITGTSGVLTGSSYALQGGSVTAKLGTGAITVSSGTITLGSAGRLNSASTLLISSGQLSLGGNESVASYTQTGGTLGGTGTLTSAATYDLQAGTVSAQLGGSAALTKSTGGTVTLTGSNTYSGGTTITGGLINFSDVSNFGSGNITLDGGGLQWATSYAGGDLSTRTITIASGNGTFNTNGNDVTLANAIGNSGSGQLIKTGTGSLTLASLSSTGGTSVQQGSLNIGSASGNIATSSGTSTAFSGNSTYSGSISGAGNVAINAGTVTFSGNNSYTGTTNVAGTSTFIINGNLTGTGALTVGSGATLKGGGSIAGATTVQSGGFLAPGNSPGSLVIGDNLYIAGTVQIELGGTSFSLNGTEEYDRIKLSGTTATLDLAGSTLNVSSWLGFVPSAGDKFGIFQLESGGSVSSTLGGFAEGATVATIGGVDIKITYTADFGDSGPVSLTGGNDIALYTAIPEPSASAALAGFGILGLTLYRRRKSVPRR